MPSAKKISMPVINRLPRYHRYLRELMSSGQSKTSSQKLSQMMGITASQVRQDFNNFGNFGQQGFGYDVESLYQQISALLGLTREYSVIVIGAGNIGRALVKYDNFAKRGYIFKAMFDTDAGIIGRNVNGITIYSIDELDSYLVANSTDIAVLALPKENALAAAEIAAKGGVSGIWNFSHVDLDLPDSVVVENVHLTDSLFTLTYKLYNNEKTE